MATLCCSVAVLYRCCTVAVPFRSVPLLFCYCCVAVLPLLAVWEVPNRYCLSHISVITFSEFYARFITSTAFISSGINMATTRSAVEHALPCPSVQFNILAHMVKRQTTIGFVSGLSECVNICPTELPPLDDAIDTSVFNNLLSPGFPFSESSRPFSFAYGEWEVSVTIGGDVSVSSSSPM